MAGFCLVTQRLGVFLEDSPADNDRLPDYHHVSGDIIFTPNVNQGSAFIVTDDRGVSTVPVVPVHAQIVDGEIVHQGEVGVYLFAAGKNSNPSALSYTVTYSNLKVGGVAFTLRGIVFEAIPGGEIDLTTATPIIGAPVAGMVKGDAFTYEDFTPEQLADLKGDRGDPGLPSPEIILPESYGAVRDGVTDDIEALEAALDEAMIRGGGTILLQGGVYAISRPLGRDLGNVHNVRIKGVGDFSSKIRCISATPIISGSWHQSTIRNVYLDAADLGGEGIRANLDKTTIDNCMIVGWQGHGMLLNQDEDTIGLLNRITNNHIAQGIGHGIYTTYRFVDSWISGNNIGSTLSNISTEAGPLRILDNHLNGTPITNLELRGNQRITIANNIMEGARQEAIAYNMPPWLTGDAPQIQITNNAFSNGGKGNPNIYPAIGIYGLAEDKQVSGFSITGNVFACQDEGSGWEYAVKAKHAKDVTCVGNQWRLGFSGTQPVGVTADAEVTVVGNTFSDGTTITT